MSVNEKDRSACIADAWQDLDSPRAVSFRAGTMVI